MSHASGFVELSAVDISLALQAMREEDLILSSRPQSRLPAEACSKYESYLNWVASWVRQFEDMVPGKIYFSETDIGRLIGILFNCFAPRMARKYRIAVLDGDHVSFSMIYQLQQLEDFELRMRNPQAAEGSGAVYLGNSH